MGAELGCIQNANYKRSEQDRLEINTPPKPNPFRKVGFNELLSSYTSVLSALRGYRARKFRKSRLVLINEEVFTPPKIGECIAVDQLWKELPENARKACG